jgi:hypothetical protein
MDGGAGLKLLAARIAATIGASAPHRHAPLLARTGATRWRRRCSAGAATKAAWATGVPEEALANATPYLQAFGHVVLAWTWLDVALAAHAVAAAPRRRPWRAGKLAACRYFYAYELPRIDAWLAPVAARDDTCREMQDDWF